MPGAGGSAQDVYQAPRQVELPEDLATVPIAKLQQLVELCAQILRESRGAHPDEPDIERDGEATTATPTFREGNASSDTQNLFHLRYIDDLPETYESKRLAMEEIWNNVSPWPIQQVPVASPEDQQRSIFASSTSELLHQFLTDRDGVYTERTQVEACIPSFRIGSDPSSERILMMACFWLVRDENVKIGRILECCYKYGVLKQPADKDSEVYLDQICLVVDCWSDSIVSLKFLWSPMVRLERKNGSARAPA